ncbi:MAG: hypothetical protein GY796_11475 [Chloroflexi bacterium]|nr:hypothetical protein [Chloroflexota bacterium]
MTDNIHTGNISDSEGVAIGQNATATVIHNYADTPPAFPLSNLPPANPNFSGR